MFEIAFIEEPIDCFLHVLKRDSWDDNKTRFCNAHYAGLPTNL